MHQFASLHGPCIVVSINPHSTSVYVYGLLSGQLMKKSYRQIRAAFAPKIFDLPLFQFFCKEVQFKILENCQLVRDDQPVHQLIPQLQKLIINLHQLLTFLSPILPSTEQTRRIINLDDDPEEDKDDEDDEDKDEDKEDNAVTDDKDKDKDEDKHVKFTTDNNKQIQTKTPRIKDAYHIPEDKDEDEEDKDKDKDDNDRDQPPTQIRDRDTPPERERTTKYLLRRQPQPKRRFPALE